MPNSRRGHVAWGWQSTLARGVLTLGCSFALWCSPAVAQQAAVAQQPTAAPATAPVTTEETVEQRLIVSIERIWDRAAHSAFTDLVKFQEQWYCTFREGSGHIPGLNGTIRVIRSPDLMNWESVALLAEPKVDLRDPKLCVTPDGRLMVNMGASTYHGSTRLGIASRVAFSNRQGLEFGAPIVVRLPAEIVTGFDWLWRVTWHDQVAYGAVQQIPNEGPRRLFVLDSADGITWRKISQVPLPAPSETTLRFRHDQSLVAMIRHGSNPPVGHVALAQPPYTQWKITPTNKAFGGPNLVRLPSGRWLAGSRDRGEKGAVTALWTVDPEQGQFENVLVLPSSGDTSYPGLVVDQANNQLVMSYYSGHEGKSAIYLARLRLDALERQLEKLPVGAR